ncbi:MAG: AgmX/PglI C-terminal domain-containing protein [Pseudomonadota bacterium]|nr:AgmX/PglI C-terminal domain-containing protein [Pseudomonadota bacterium]
MLLALVLPAAAAGIPASLTAYDQAVTSVTLALTSALPRLAACKAVPGEKLVFKVNLAGVPVVTTVALTGTASATVSAPCHEKVVADVFTRSRPSVGLEAAVVVDVFGGTPRLDGDVALFGSLGREAIESGVRTRMDRVAQCYVNALEAAPGIKGDVVVSMTVLPTGQVLSADLKRTTLWSPPTEACVLKEMLGVVFAAPDGGALVRVTYPFTFKPPEP